MGSHSANQMSGIKLSQIQKNLLIRWINSLHVWGEELSVQNVIEELKTGVLICQILHFYQPKLDIL